MADNKKRDRNNKLIGMAIGILSITFFVTSFYLGAGTH
jgi:predicted nucleic acid-binding Zn ribbon protein